MKRWGIWVVRSSVYGPHTWLKHNGVCMEFYTEDKAVLMADGLNFGADTNVLYLVVELDELGGRIETCMTERDFLFWMTQSACLGALDKRGIDEWEYWWHAGWRLRDEYRPRIFRKTGGREK